MQIRGLRAPAAEFCEPLAGAAPDIRDGCAGERKRSGSFQEPDACTRCLLLPVLNFGAMPGVEAGWNSPVAPLELGADSFGFFQTAFSIRARKGSRRRRRTGKPRR